MGGCVSTSQGAVPALSRAPASAARRCLTAPIPWHSTVSQKELYTMREEFWATRVGGDPNMWLALRRACEAVLSEDVSLAEALMDASGLKTADGSIAACYDDRGFAYKLPVHCFCDPVDTTTSGAVQSKADAIVADSKGNDVFTDNGEESGELINIKVRINPGEKNAMVRCSLDSPVRAIRQRVSQLDEMSSADVSLDRLRLIFMGRELKDDKQLLRDAKIDESRILQVFIRPLN